MNTIKSLAAVIALSFAVACASTGGTTTGVRASHSSAAAVSRSVEGRGLAGKEGPNRKISQAEGRARATRARTNPFVR